MHFFKEQCYHQLNQAAWSRNRCKVGEIKITKLPQILLRLSHCRTANLTNSSSTRSPLQYLPLTVNLPGLDRSPIGPANHMDGVGYNGTDYDNIMCCSSSQLRLAPDIHFPKIINYYGIQQKYHTGNYFKWFYP